MFSGASTQAHTVEAKAKIELCLISHATSSASLAAASTFRTLKIPIKVADDPTLKPRARRRGRAFDTKYGKWGR